MEWPIALDFDLGVLQYVFLQHRHDWAFGKCTYRHIHHLPPVPTKSGLGKVTRLQEQERLLYLRISAPSGRRDEILDFLRYKIEYTREYAGFLAF